MSDAQLIPNLPRESYDKAEGVRWSMLKHLKQSPAHYREALKGEGKDSDALKVGRALHIAVYEPERYPKAVTVWGTRKTEKVRNGSVWDDFQAEHADREILTVAEAALVDNVARAVRGSGDARKYVEGGQGEVTIFWDCMGMGMKSRLDFVANCGALVDLKTCEDASPVGFGKSAASYDYLGQAAFYSDAYEAATGRRLPFVFIAAEKCAPWVVQVYRVTDAQLESGRREYRALLEQLAFCRSTSSWPAYFDGEAELVLPRWKQNEIEEAA